MKNKLLILIGSIIIWGSVYIYALPYIAVADLKEAVKNNDVYVLEGYVDSDALRHNIKDQFNATIVASIVTPEGIRKIFEGKNPVAINKGGRFSNEEYDKRFERVQMGYLSHEKFEVFIPVESHSGENTGLKLILEREGFDWRLANFIVPFDQM